MNCLMSKSSKCKTSQSPSRTCFCFTFCGSFEENLAAATGECAVMAARCLVRTDQARPLWGEEELHGEHVLPASLKPAVRHTRHGWVAKPVDYRTLWLYYPLKLIGHWGQIKLLTRIAQQDLTPSRPQSSYNSGEVWRCGKNRGWVGLAAALNTERLEKTQTQRCLSDMKLRYQGLVLKEYLNDIRPNYFI